jgi:glycine/D-amino acid oxidase-like deaminating enzyme
MATLEERTKALSQAGIRAECLSAASLHALEPELYVGHDGGAMFLPEDCQIDAFQAVSLIEKVSSAEFRFHICAISSGLQPLTFSFNRPMVHIPQKEDIWRSIMILPCH